jgi:hypothetical protein
MSHIIYSDTLTVGEGLEKYLSHFGLGDGGYNNPVFTLPFLWIITLKFPNIPLRVKAVKFHDIHHVLTEYPTGFRGEAEIGAWEIASGCGKYWPAWVLNFAAFVNGIVFFPGSTFRAFVRGRRSDNLFHQQEYQNILCHHVGDMREALNIPKTPQKIFFTDILGFVWWSIVGILFFAAPIIVLIYMAKLIWNF